MVQVYGSTAPSVRILGVREECFHLALGLLLAPLLTLTPLLQLVGWYFRALVHEMGHAAAAWLTGVPAVPALALTAEAGTMHGEQHLAIVFIAWALVLTWVWRRAESRARLVFLGIFAVLFPVLCFTGLREGWHLVSGHLGELAVGGLFLARALSGGFSHGNVERTLYATLGWSLVGQNLFLTAGLALSRDARVRYATSGSFGIENDYLRLAEWSGTSLEACAFVMTLLALAVAPAVVGLWVFGERRAS